MVSLSRVLEAIKYSLIYPVKEEFYWRKPVTLWEKSSNEEVWISMSFKFCLVIFNYQYRDKQLHCLLKILTILIESIFCLFCLILHMPKRSNNGQGKVIQITDTYFRFMNYFSENEVKALNFKTYGLVFTYFVVSVRICYKILQGFFNVVGQISTRVICTKCKFISRPRKLDLIKRNTLR